MFAQVNFLSATKRVIQEFGSGHRVAGVIVLVILATFGAMQWMHSGASVAVPNSGQQQAQADNAPASVPYFPAQYVNQATQAEKPIDSF